MFGSTILEVVIGLVFVFLLYSLLATILQEMISSWLSLRGRVLRKAIERMLNDSNAWEREKKSRHRLVSFFFGNPKKFRNSMAGKFYAHPSIKYLSKRSRWPSYISATNFSETLFSLIREKGAGENEMAKVAFAIRFNTPCFEAQTLKQVRGIYNASQDDLNLFKQKLKDWFEESMDRATGWYKRKIKLILFVIGFVIAMVFNVNCIHIVQILSKDKVARGQMLQLGIAATDTSSKIAKSVKNVQDSAAKKSYAEVQTAIKESQQILGGGWNGAGPGTILLSAFNVLRQPFWGFLITALAVSLGAKFWFGILNKLVALRNAGVKPEEKEAQKKTAPDTPLAAGAALAPASPNPPPADSPVLNLVEDAVRRYSAELRKIAGVMSVFAVNKKNAARVMQVNVVDGETAALVKSWYEEIKKTNTTLAAMEIVISGVPQRHEGNTAAAGQIANANLKNFGSLACVLEQSGSGQKHLLSCWHVMKGDLDFSHEDSNTKIIDWNLVPVAERWCGGISGPFDYGIAQCLSPDGALSNAFLKSALGMTAKEELSFRAVISDDVEQQIEIKLFNCLNQQMRSGILYAASKSVAINYLDKTRNVEDVLVLCNMEGNGSISVQGNSGALIFDASNKALGMIIGGDAFYSYAIRLSGIFNIHSDFTISQ